MLVTIVSLAALGTLAALAGRDALAAATNRVALRRSAWAAEECAERVRAAASSAAAAAANPTLGRHDTWAQLDTEVRDSPLVREVGCDVSVRALGARLDVNEADAGALRVLFLALGARSSGADSLADAVMDWRDGDDVPRPSGAERAWYETARRVPPRNGDIADPRELRLVRGFEAFASVDSVLGVEEGRVALSRAPIAVLATLPGFGEEALAYIARQRAAGEPVGDLIQLSGAISRGAREMLLAHFAELAGKVTSVPDGWIAVSRGPARAGEPRAAVELALVSAGARAAVVRRRSWP